MANLETLELTINANAEGASRGISRLIGSLSALSDAIVKPYSDLVDFNNELAKLKQIRSIKIPNISVATNAAGAVRGATKGSTAEPMARKPLTVTNNLGAATMASEEERKAAHPEWYRTREEFEQIIKQQQSAFAQKQAQAQAMADTRNAASGTASVASQTSANNALSNSAKEVAKSTNEATAAIRKNSSATTEAASNTSKASGAFSKFASTIGRIGKMMLIRTAMRSLIKGFSEAWEGAYNFSKKMGGDFAKSIDAAKSAMNSIAINAVRVFAPMMQAILPVINTIAYGFQFLANVIMKLMKLLGFVSDLFGATAEQISATGSAGSSASKNLLAGFDELNVLDQGGGGGGGGGGSSNLAGIVGEQLAQVQVLVGEALLAVGLVLAFCGHPAVGLALAAVGAAAIAGTIVESWGKLSEDVKKEIVNIMAIASASFLAVGMIIALAVPSMRGLGIALMAAGLANMVTAAALSWNLTDDVKKNIAEIATIAGTSMIGIGLILALGVPTMRGLGIGLLAAGIGSMATAVAVAWNTSAEVKKQLTEILTMAGASMLAIGLIIALACPAMLPLGIGMMVAGGISLASAVALNWDSLSGKVKSAFDKITKGVVAAWQTVTTAVSVAWEAVKAWAAAKWSSFSRGWDNIKQNFSKLWSNVGRYVSEAWENVKTWVAAKWSDLSRAWDNIKDNMGKLWGTVGRGVSNAWENVKTWISAKWSDLSRSWDNIKDNLGKVWNNVKNNVSGAWEKVKDWLGASWSNFSRGWDNIKDGFEKIWEKVEGFVGKAWDKLMGWTGVSWDDFRANWDNIKKSFDGAWGDIGGYVSTAYVKVSTWADTKWEKFKNNWENIKSNFSTVWGNIKESAQNAYSKVSTWVLTKWDSFKTNWSNIKKEMENVWTGVKDKVGEAWINVNAWITTKKTQFKNWVGSDGVQGFISGAWTGIKSAVKNAYDEAKKWWESNGMVQSIKNAWKGIKDWFKTYVTDPISNAFNNAIDTIKNWINHVIRGLNNLGKFTIPGLTIDIPWIGKTTLWNAIHVKLWDIAYLPLRPVTHAEGAYGIDKGRNGWHYGW